MFYNFVRPQEYTQCVELRNTECIVCLQGRTHYWPRGVSGKRTIAVEVENLIGSCCCCHVPSTVEQPTPTSLKDQIRASLKNILF